MLMMAVRIVVSDHAANAVFDSAQSGSPIVTRRCTDIAVVVDLGSDEASDEKIKAQMGVRGKSAIDNAELTSIEVPASHDVLSGVPSGLEVLRDGVWAERSDTRSPPSAGSDMTLSNSLSTGNPSLGRIVRWRTLATSGKAINPNLDS